MVCAVALASQPDAGELMGRSVEVIKADWAAAREYSFIKTAVKTKHDGQSAKKTYQVLTIEGSPYMEVEGEDGHPLSAARRVEEERKLQEERQKRLKESPRERDRRIAKYAEDRNRDYGLLCEMAYAFEYKIQGEQNINGYDAWVLEGTPNPNYLPKTREAKVLTGMNVKFWIDKSTYQWLKLEAEVVKTVPFYGALAKVSPGTKFMLEQEPVSGDVWLPKRFTVTVKALEFGFINADSSEEETYTNYRRMADVVSEIQAKQGGPFPAAVANSPNP